MATRNAAKYLALWGPMKVTCLDRKEKVSGVWRLKKLVLTQLLFLEKTIEAFSKRKNMAEINCGKESRAKGFWISLGVFRNVSPMCSNVNIWSL